MLIEECAKPSTKRAASTVQVLLQAAQLPSLVSVGLVEKEKACICDADFLQTVWGRRRSETSFTLPDLCAQTELC